MLPRVSAIKCLKNTEHFFTYRFVTMSSGGFNLTVQVIPECAILWQSHLISQRSCMKRPQVLSSSLKSWVQKGSLWLREPAWLCSKELAWCPFLNSCMSSSPLAMPSFSSRHSALLGPNVHGPYQPDEGWLTSLFVNWKYISKTGIRVSFQYVNPVDEREKRLEISPVSLVTYQLHVEETPGRNSKKLLLSILFVSARMWPAIRL